MGCGGECMDSVLPKCYPFGRTLQQAVGILGAAVVHHREGMRTVLAP